MQTIPQWQRQRVAALSRTHSPQSPALVEARRDLLAAKAEDYIKQLVDAAPPLSADQRSRLAVLLLGGGVAA